MFNPSYLAMSCRTRMKNLYDGYDYIYMLEDYESYNNSNLKEVNISQNEINIFQNLVIVCYDSSEGIKEGKFSINELKQNFLFIKIINNNNEEINFLVLNNKNYTEDELLEKINNKATFGNDIKKNLMLDEFPINNYYLQRNYNISNDTLYDEIYILEKGNKKNNINSINNISQMSKYSNDDNINYEGEIINSIKKLEEKMNKIENNLEKKIEENSKVMNERLNNLENLFKLINDLIKNKYNKKINNNY